MNKQPRVIKVDGDRMTVHGHSPVKTEDDFMASFRQEQDQRDQERQSTMDVDKVRKEMNQRNHGSYRK